MIPPTYFLVEQVTRLLYAVWGASPYLILGSEVSVRQPVGLEDKGRQGVSDALGPTRLKVLASSLQDQVLHVVGLRLELVHEAAGKTTRIERNQWVSVCISVFKTYFL